MLFTIACAETDRPVDEVLVHASSLGFNFEMIVFGPSDTDYNYGVETDSQFRNLLWAQQTDYSWGTPLWFFSPPGFDNAHGNTNHVLSFVITQEYRPAYSSQPSNCQAVVAFLLPLSLPNTCPSAKHDYDAT